MPVLPEPVAGSFTADSGVTADTGAFDASGGLVAFARVQAVAPGFYRGVFRNIGDVFDIYLPQDLSDSTVSSVPVGDPDYPLYGWMLKVGAQAPLTDYSLSTQGASSPVVATQATNAAGQRVFGQAAGVGARYVV